MAKIILNDEFEVNGKLSISRTLNEQGDGFIVTGTFATHLYIEDIHTLESPRYKVYGVEVFQEMFGSDDYDIVYNFQATILKIKGAIKDGIGFILYPKEMEAIEEEMYKNDHPVLGGIGEQYKDMYKKGDDEDDK